MAGELQAALAKFSSLIAFQTDATKRVLIGSLLTEKEAGLDRAIAPIPPPVLGPLTSAAPKSATSTVVSSVRSWGATGCCVIFSHLGELHRGLVFLFGGYHPRPTLALDFGCLCHDADQKELNHHLPRALAHAARSENTCAATANSLTF
jgi:hypothetical protein